MIFTLNDSSTPAGRHRITAVGGTITVALQEILA